MRRLTIEELASMSEDAAARRAFDERNLVALRLLIWFFLVASFFQLVHSVKNDWFNRGVAIVDVAMLIMTLLIVRDLRGLTTRGINAPVRLIRRNIRAWTLGFLVAQYALFVAYTTRQEHDWMVWSIIFPFFFLAFRFLPAEILLFHGIVILTVAVQTFFRIGEIPNKAFRAVWIAVLIANIATAILGLVMSRRFRRSAVADFRGQRDDAREQLRMRGELQYAREMQLAMLPEEAPRLDWLDIAASSLPATEVGGDYYDYFAVGEDRLAVVCGDVAGHGLASGLVLATLRSGFMLLRESLSEPATVLRRLHQLIVETSRRRMHVTVALLLLDRARQTATLASAGHPPTILRRNNGHTEAVELFAVPLGAGLLREVPETVMPFAPGDVFVLHSDGVYESRNPAGDYYGLDRLAAVVASAKSDAASIRDAICGDVEKFRDGEPLADDLTIVVVRVTSPSAAGADAPPSPRAS